MNRWRAGLTSIDRLIIILAGILALIILVALLLPALARSREDARLIACSRNLKTIGKALSAYRNDNSGYLPFSWGPADSAPKAFNNAAASSLGLLYPKYLKTAAPFHCPSIEDEPAFVPNGEGANQTWTLTGSSYVYDPRVSSLAVRTTAIMSDFALYIPGADSIYPNHASGQNVLYADGRVEWTDSDFASNNPNDNIFAQDPWDADTDTFLVRGDLNNLTISFDGYDHLK